MPFGLFLWNPALKDDLTPHTNSFFDSQKVYQDLICTNQPCAQQKSWLHGHPWMEVNQLNKADLSVATSIGGDSDFLKLILCTKNENVMKLQVVAVYRKCFPMNCKWCVD